MEKTYLYLAPAQTEPSRAHEKAQFIPTQGIAVVDDCEFIRAAWQRMHADHALMTFESPEAFWDYVGEHPDFFDSLALIVTDQNFGNKSTMTGIEFSRTIIGKPVVLSSSDDFSHALPILGITAVLPKKVLEWRELERYFMSQPIDDEAAKTTSDFLDDLKVKFFVSSTDIVSDIEMAANEQDHRRVAELVHKLKGAALLVDARTIINACRQRQDHQAPDEAFIELLKNSLSEMEHELRVEGLITT
jgi:HPt (histidine-containing phosphotransfer) domain-containing protein